MKYHIRKVLFFLIIILFATVLGGKDIPQRPSTAVADYISLLETSQRRALENKLKIFNDTSSSAIVIVIDGSTEGEDIFDYSYRLATKWGIGNKGKDNGVLLYIAFNDRKIYIQSGSGLEGTLPDAVLKRIIENIITPAFRESDYYGGLDKSVDIMTGLISGEFTADEFVKDDTVLVGTIFIIIFLIIFIVIAISIYRCKKRGDCNEGGGYYDGGRYNSGGGWLIGGSGFGGSSGSGGFGGGGGFGGFSGGGFSGGGAGGGW